MERALYAEDPKFASSLRGSDLRVLHRRRVVKAAAGVLVGIALLLTGVIVQLVPLGVAGALVMILSALLAVHSWRQIPSADGSGRPVVGRTKGRGSRPASGGRGNRKLMQRLED